MKKFLAKIVTYTVIVNAVFAFGISNSAYAISGTDVTLSSLSQGVLSTATVSFTPGIDIPADGKIKVTFGAGFTLTSVGASDGSCSTMDGDFTTSVSSQEVTITRSGGSIDAFGSPETCTIANVINPTSIGSTGTYTIETTDAADSQIEIDAAVAADTITAGDPNPALTINSATPRTDGSGVVDISATFTVYNSGSDDGVIKVEYKEGANCSSGTSDPTLDEDTANISATYETTELFIENDNEYQVGSGPDNYITTDLLPYGTPNTVLFDWQSATDVPTADGTYCLKMTPGVDGGSGPFGTAQTTTFTLDNAAPTDPAGFGQSSVDETSITLGWIPSSETNFDHYEIWYGQKESSVESQASETTFTETTIDNAIGDAEGVVASDLDEDGDQDLIVLVQSNSDVLWYKNDGAGSFTKYTIESNFNGALSAKVIDLDEDGDKDVVVAASWANEIAWYENDGSENFAARQSIATGIDYADDVDVADLDGDGDLDVVGTGINDTDLIWQENDGSENFTPNVLASDYASGVQSVDIGDLDSDGDQDIVVNNDNRSELGWWENDGSGNFSENIISSGGGNHTTVEIVDLDQDGDEDILMPSLGTFSLRWWENDGSESFSSTDLFSGTLSSTRGADYADFDNDGDYDVIVGGQTADEIVWGENDGSESYTRYSVTTNFEVNNNHVLEAVDLDGDGYADFAAVGNSNSPIDFAWYQNSGTAFEWDDGDDGDLATVSTAATTITGLTANSLYYFERWAFDTYGNSSTAVPAAIAVYTAAAVPGAPTVATVTQVSAEVTVDENGNSVTTEYAIQEDNSEDYVQGDGSLDSSEIWQTAEDWGTVIVTGLTPATTYTFQVKARNGDLTQTSFGSSTDAVTEANTPGAPTVSGVSSSSVNVIIDENSNGSDATYSIAIGANYVQADGSLNVGKVWQSYDDWGGASGVNVTGLTAGTEYSATVQARNSGLSETPASSAGSDYTLPAAPGAPTIGTITETTAQVTIVPNGNPASTEYVIQESNSGSYVQTNGSLGVGEIWQDAATWGTVTVTGLSPASINTFITKAKSLALDESLFGSGSNAVAIANVPGAPTVSGVSSSSVNVIIDQNSNSSDADYSIAVGANYVQANGSLGAGEIWQSYTSWGGASGVNVTGLTPGTQYSVTVKARNAIEIATVASSSGSDYTSPAVPGVLNTGTITETTAELTIDANGNPASTVFAIYESDSGNYVQANGSLGVGAVWQTAAVWGTVTVTGLTPASSNTFTSKARSSDTFEESAFGPSTDVVAVPNTPAAPTATGLSSTTMNVVINENSNSSDAEYSISVDALYVQIDGTLDVGEVFQDYATWGGVSGITVTGLTPATNYSVTAKARNDSLVETVDSPAGTDYTLPATPGAPTIGTITETTAEVTIDTNGNAATAKYVIRESGSGNYVQSDGSLAAGEIWQSAASWGTVTVTGLTPSSINAFTVKSRNIALDESAFSAQSSAVALSNTPGAPTAAALSTSSINIIIDENSNTSDAEYSIAVDALYVQADGSLAAGEIWQSYDDWGGVSGVNVTGLVFSTTYSVTVIARNFDEVESAVSTATSVTTQTPEVAASSGGRAAAPAAVESVSPLMDFINDIVAPAEEVRAEERAEEVKERAEERAEEAAVRPIEAVEAEEEVVVEAEEEAEEVVVVEAEEEDAVTLAINDIDEVLEEIELLEREEKLEKVKKEVVPPVEKTKEEKLLDAFLNLDTEKDSLKDIVKKTPEESAEETTEDAPEKARKALEEAVNTLLKERLADAGVIDESDDVRFYNSFEEAEKARAERPSQKSYDTSTDKNEDGVSEFFQGKKGYTRKYTDASGKPMDLIDKVILGGDPEISNETLITEIPKIANFGKGQKVRGNDVSLIIGTTEKQNISVHIFSVEEDVLAFTYNRALTRNKDAARSTSTKISGNKKLVKTINTKITDGNKDVVTTNLPAGKYYAVPVGDKGSGKPVKLIVEEESDDMKLVLVDDVHLMNAIFNMLREYELIPEDFAPEKTYIQGYSKPGTTVIVSWKSVVLNSVVVADASQGYFKVEVPKKLAQGNHDALVYAYDENSLIYSITHRAAFRKVNE